MSAWISRIVAFLFVSFLVALFVHKDHQRGLPGETWENRWTGYFILSVATLAVLVYFLANVAAAGWLITLVARFILGMDPP